jgi:ubiquinone/menaquinone biosynthesis C-methylase UbiE
MDLPEEADAYASADFADVNEAFAERVAALATDPAALALDLGTGPVDIPVRVVARRPGWSIVAIDAARAMLRLGREATRSSSIRLLQADTKRLPLRDQCAGVIFSNSILHHLPDPSPFWREIRRVGRPGAPVLVRDLARPGSEAEAERLVFEHAGDESPLLREEFHRSLLAAFTPEEVRGQLGQAGLHTLDVAMVSDRHLDVCGVLP